MRSVYLTQLHELLRAIAGRMPLFVARGEGSNITYGRFEEMDEDPISVTTIRACIPVKEFVFPALETTGIYPAPAASVPGEPFAVWGLKSCDIHALDVLDRVFLEKGYEDPSYRSRRSNMFIITSDCSDPMDSCFCDAMGGGPFTESGFDLNVSSAGNGFIVDIGTDRGERAIKDMSGPIEPVPESLSVQREGQREEMLRRLQDKNKRLHFSAAKQQIVASGYDSPVFDEQARGCIECQACTRICPTCHCFYLYDAKKEAYFQRMKMWDSCMRMAYAQVAGGGNPRKILGDRIRHRMMHKFSYFVDRYGIEMCVGCGRCVDAEAGQVDIREILIGLDREFVQ